MGGYGRTEISAEQWRISLRDIFAFVWHTRLLVERVSTHLLGTGIRDWGWYNL